MGDVYLQENKNRCFQNVVGLNVKGHLSLMKGKADGLSHSLCPQLNTAKRRNYITTVYIFEHMSLNAEIFEASIIHNWVYQLLYLVYMHNSPLTTP
jgi:hypothetical protein